MEKQTTTQRYTQKSGSPVRRPVRWSSDKSQALTSPAKRLRGIWPRYGVFNGPATRPPRLHRAPVWLAFREKASILFILKHQFL